MVVDLVILLLITNLIHSLLQLLEYHAPNLKSRQGLLKRPLQQRISRFLFDYLDIFDQQIFLFLQTVYFGYIVSTFTKNILAHVASFFLTDQPFVCLNVVEVDVPAWVRHVASDCVWEKHAFMDSDIFYGDIPYSHSGLSLADPFAEWVKHAARSITIRLLHLLRPYVNSPPNRLIHCKVFEVKVLNNASALVAGVRLDIDAFDWSNELPVYSSDIPNTIPSC